MAAPATMVAQVRLMMASNGTISSELRSSLGVIVLFEAGIWSPWSLIERANVERSSSFRKGEDIGSWVDVANKVSES